ncbi:hypothetical protein KUCAC02_024506 [Chaenocephalus aceratus]|uniref:Uncharacterized protein n=1 Tax=Chaenocephalus aceratus TaxID=36190 RepID=A0ACB9WID4_CHAAC|nr:hypothetical protein KUCAC02_024506 [Chaenocephalus aceratus]
MGSLEAELKALVSLEEVKGSLVRGNVKEVEAVCHSLVEKEVARLMLASEMDKEALLYLNSIFSLFPSQAWRAAQAALQLHYNGEGSLSSRASQTCGKTVLSPATTSSPPSSLPFTNGGPKHNHSLKAGCPASWSWPSGSRAQQDSGWAWPLLPPGASPDKRQDLEVELLLVSGRPNAILQALRTLMAKQQWERVTMVAQKFCKRSPLLNKEIFTTLLCEVAQHRDLDPYLDVLWALCPEDLTVTTILNLVLKNLPSPNTPPSSSSSSSSFSMSSTTSSSPPPFADSHSSQLNHRLLKPLLKKVLQRETKPSQALRRHPTVTHVPPLLPPHASPELSQILTQTHLSQTTPPPDYLAETPGQQSPPHTAVQRARVALPANPV